ncbi:MAG: hypothetical protein ABI559_11220 [Chloroflexota bacterium]
MARVAGSIGAALIVIGFFLPWLDGTGAFAARDFSGFDLARLVRNFEIATPNQGSQLRATAIALYLVPALAVNGAVLGWFLGRASAIAMLVGGLYAAAILGVALMLSLVSWTDLGDVLGAPRLGFLVSAAGCALVTQNAVALLLANRALAPVEE